MRSATVEIQNPNRKGYGRVIAGRLPYAQALKAFLDAQESFEPEDPGDFLALEITGGGRKTWKPGRAPASGQVSSEPLVLRPEKEEPEEPCGCDDKGADKEPCDCEEEALLLNEQTADDPLRSTSEDEDAPEDLPGQATINFDPQEGADEGSRPQQTKRKTPAKKSSRSTKSGQK
ncbi:MAG: hypothetical protein AAF191_11145 [Verrucomicrobiota bacterium]